MTIRRTSGARLEIAIAGARSFILQLGSSFWPRNRKSRLCNLLTNDRKKTPSSFLRPQRRMEGEELII